VRNFKETIRNFRPLGVDELLLSAVAAMLRLRFVGAPTGVGNQALHMVFLEHLRDPEAFAGDSLLQTLPRFSTWFFHVFAALLPRGLALEPVLMTAHALTTWLTFAAFVALVKGTRPQTRMPCLVLIPLVGLSLSGLAESPINPLGFTHSSLAFALSLVVLNLLVRGKLVAALALVGLMANIHLLTAAYTAALAGMWGLWRARGLPIRATALGMLTAAVLALPIMTRLGGGGGFDAAWLTLLEVRSAHHVWPSTWWNTGDASIAGFALWAGALALARGVAPDAKRHIDPWVMAAGVLMLLGWVGSEWIPIPLIMRAQLFRASGYVVVAALVAVTHAVDRCLHAPFPAKFPASAAALAVTAALWIPGLGAWSVTGLLAGAWALWWAGGLNPGTALAAGGALVVATLSDLHLGTAFWRPELARWPAPELSLILLGLALAAAAAPCRRRVRLPAIGAACLLLVTGLRMWPVLERPEDPWREIQLLAREHTPADAVLLTPVRHSGFRLGSRRALVGEWRDGTQQFFDPVFAVGWDARMRSLDPQRTREFTEAEWMRAAAEWNATHLVLPRNDRLRLVRLAENDVWMLCLPEEPPPPPLPDPPDNAVNPADWLAQERFMLEVVEPNLRRNRTSTVTLRALDAAGRPLPGVVLEVEQTASAFHIGSALNHFSNPPAHSPEFRAPLVHEKELELFLEVFNYSVIGFSGKWLTFEPEEGRRDLSALDAYVDWCHRNGIEIEYHFVCGYEPAWLREKSREEQQAALMRHASDLIDRYGGRISVWQIVNERRLQALAPPVFALFRERLPHALLGVSHCARFFSEREDGRRDRDLLRGWDSVSELRAHGAEIDYFAVHAHRPFGTWWDPRVIYEVLDEYQARGLRVRVTETGVSHAGKIEGSVLSGNWNEELQADYLRRFLTVLYSHPNVDAVNFWGFGPRTWQANISLLNNRYEPRPAFETLRHLVREEWRTRETLESNRVGEARLTGFHGDYRVSARLPDGSEVGGSFTLSPDTAVRVELRLGK